MTESEALELLKIHSYSHENVEEFRLDRGFLGMLRPFTGKLYKENFHELMAILYSLQHKFSNSQLDRDVISSFWSICHLGRSWALDKDGMLRRNNLISDTQVQQLSDWIDCISYTIMNLLDDSGNESPFEQYESNFRDKI